MATYRLEAKIIGRSRGRSATASAAYRAAERIDDARSGQSFDYSRKRGVLHAEILTPPDTPAWMQDRAQLWNAVEKVEKRKDAQLARDLILSLPHELTADQRRDLVREFVADEFVAQGMIADIAIHAPDRRGDQRNHHAHVMLTMRSIAGEKFGNKVRDWNDTEQLEAWRAHWAEAVNRDLERYGHAARVDHRSLEAQGIDREPEPKQGPIATEMEREGRASHAGDDRRAAQARNEERAEIAAELVAVSAQIIDLESERQKRAGDEAMEKLVDEEAARRAIEAAAEKQNREAHAAADQAEPPKEATPAAPQRKVMDEPTPAMVEQQHQREAAALHDLAEQDKRIAEFKRQRDAEAEQARKKEQERQRADERRAAEGEIASASDRYAQALGQHYDIRDPYGSLARAAMSEYGAFKRQQAELQKDIAKAKDPEERAALELRRQIEGCDYMAVTSQRLAGISATIAGREDAPAAIADRERAAAWQEQANRLREERAQQQQQRADRRQGQEPAPAAERTGTDKSAEKPAERDTDWRGETTDRYGEMTDAKVARQAAGRDGAGDPFSREQTRPSGRGGSRGGRG